MGLVYRAYHAQLERTGAIKVMQAITPDADTVARFRHEAQAIARLRHPNIVDVYDFGDYQGTPYMIVEYVSGGSLASRMSDGLLDRTTALRYLRGIAAGLDYAHDHGIVHRDVKPANVLLTAEDTPVLADFGLAKLLQGSSLKSMTGVTTGTPAYMAPEQVTGHQVGPAADRYSLATIAYEMLTGYIPFDGEALMELLYAQVHREPMVPSTRLPALGSAVDAVVMRGLAKDPAARWNTCTEFVDALASALSGVSRPAVERTVAFSPQLASTVPVAAGAAVAERVAAPPHSAATVAMPFPSVGPAAAAAKRNPRRRWLIGAAALLVLLLVLGVCAIAAQATTLAVNPSTAARGDFVRITATHVPANQAGQIQLLSVVHTYPFRANASGDVTLDIAVPRDINLGNHVVQICWNGSCHKQTTLKVVAGAGETQPTPTGNQTPSPSSGHSPTPTPTSGSTSHPTSTPTSRPTSPPTAPPTSPPPPASPTPTLNPCPPESPVLTSPPGTLVAPTSITVAGSGFTPNKTATVAWSLGGKGEGSKTVTITSAGTFSVTFPVPLLATGNGVASATDSCGRSATKAFTIAAGL
jgi:serine/threonine-protein kinase